MLKPMTKYRIAKYNSLKREIGMLEDQIISAGYGKDFVVDYAKEYSTGHPRVITLRGYGSQDVPKLSARRAWCFAECKTIEDFIASLDDSVMRQLLTRRYIEGRTTAEAAQLVGYSRKQATRLINGFFEKMSHDVP